MSDYYDREELTRPGHIPSLVSGFGALAGCSCGWLTDPLPTITEASRAVRKHISDVDAGVI